MTPSNGKKKLRRTVRLVLLSALVLATLGVIAVLFVLDPLARQAVETQASAALNRHTTAGSVTVHPFTGRVVFSDLRIASPPGFKTPDLAVLPSAEMVIAFSELRNDPVHVNSITMTHPKFVIEGNGTNVNLKQMTDQIPVPIDAVHLVIDQVTLQDATVVLRHLPGVRDEATVAVETFTLAGIGADRTGGASIKDAVTQLVASLTIHACNSPQMPAEFRAWLKGDVGQLVHIKISDQINRVLSVFRGSHDPRELVPVDKWLNGLFGSGPGHSGTTKPDE